MAELTSSPEKTGGRVPRKRLTARVDLTAMVDLAFLLITFFMLTTSLEKPKMFNLAMPVDIDSEGVPESRTMTICLGKNNQVISWLGLAEKPLTAPKLSGFNKDGVRREIIETTKNVLAATGKSLIVVIKPSDHAVYSDLVNTLDELKITGSQTYAVVDITPKDVDLLKQQKAY